MKTLFRLSLLFSLAVISLQAQNAAFQVRVTGEGDPVLLFPGFTCTGDVWEETVTSLSQKYECHVFTFAGFGEVPPLKRETPWLTQVKEGVEDYVDTHNLNQPHLIGHSLGGSLSLWLAAENTMLYGRLVIVDGLPSIGALLMPNYDSKNISYENPYNTQLLEMDEKAFDAMANQMATGMTQNESKREQIVQWMKQSDRYTYVYGYTDLLKLDLRESISGIKNPVTILGATFPYGKEIATNTYKTQFKALGTYDLRMAEGSAHFIMYDKPEWFDEQIKKVFNIN